MSEVQVIAIGPKGPKRFTGKLNRADFKDHSLIRADFRGCSLQEADFTGADCSFANFEGANCWGANFSGANLRRANFKDAILSNANLDARDTFGMTLTMSCETFTAMRCGKLWWAWMMFGTMMKGPDELAGDKLIALIGQERYVKYKAAFQQREF